MDKSYINYFYKGNAQMDMSHINYFYKGNAQWIT